MYPCWDLTYSLSDSCNFTCLLAFMSSPFSTWTGFGVSGSDNSLRYGLYFCSP